MGRDGSSTSSGGGSSDFNPLSPHGERRQARDRRQAGDAISIHSPRMGRDPAYLDECEAWAQFQSTLPAWGETAWRRPRPAPPCISIHSPRMGRDPAYLDECEAWAQFQSTLPAWGETAWRRPRPAPPCISIHSPRMGRDGHPMTRIITQTIISIHSPRMGRDPAPFGWTPPQRRFQSTLPAWGETYKRFRVGTIRHNFNPLSPHGERPTMITIQPAAW